MLIKNLLIILLTSEGSWHLVSNYDKYTAAHHRLLIQKMKRNINWMARNEEHGKYHH